MGHLPSRLEAHVAHWCETRQKPADYRLHHGCAVRDASVWQGEEKDGSFILCELLLTHPFLMQKPVKMVEINFLCVNKGYRDKRIAPVGESFPYSLCLFSPHLCLQVLIKEITRRVNLNNIWQAVYVDGFSFPSRISLVTKSHQSTTQVYGWRCLASSSGFMPLLSSFAQPAQAY